MDNEPNPREYEIEVTFPANAPAGTRFGHCQHNHPGAYDYISQSGTEFMNKLYVHDLIVELPSGWVFKNWVITNGHYEHDKTETDNFTCVKWDDFGTVTFVVEQKQQDWQQTVTPDPTGNIIHLTYGSEPTIDITERTLLTKPLNVSTTYLAEAKPGYRFKDWLTVSQGGGGRTYTDNPLILDWGSPEGCFAVTGHFEEDASTANVIFHLNSTSQGAAVQYKVGLGAYTDITDGGVVTVNVGQQMTFKVKTMPSGKALDHWVIGSQTSTEATPTFTVTETTHVYLYLKSSAQTFDLNVKFDSSAAGHAKIKYTIDGESQVIAADLPQPISVERNKQVTFSLNSISSGYMFKRWVVRNDDTGTTVDKKNQMFSQNITYNTTVTLYLARKYRITVTQGDGGKITPGSKDVEEGSDATFNIIPNEHYRIADVIVDGQSQGAIEEYTFYNVTATHTITAVYTEVPKCQVKVTYGAGGKITPSGTVYIYEGEVKQFVITPDSGYLIENVVYDGSSQGAITQITIPYSTAGHTLSATFKRDKTKYTINVQSLGHGTIVSSATEVYEGESVTITTTPDTDYFLKEIVDNGKSKGAINPYIINNIRENHTVVASFDRTPTARTLMYIKEDGAWKVINVELTPEIYVKINGVWIQLFTTYDAPMMYVKESGVWHKLFTEINNRLL